MTRIETILTGIAALLLIALLGVMPIDIMDFYSDKETYVMVHELNTNHSNWEWQYLYRWLYLGLISVTGLTIITLRLIKKNNTIVQKINWAFILLGISKNLIFYNLNPFPFSKREGGVEFLEMPFYFLVQ